MNPLAIVALLSFLATSGLGIFLHNWDVDRLEAEQAKALEAQKQADMEICNQQKENTANAVKEATDRLAELQLKLDAPRVRYVSKCATVISKPASTGHGETKPGPLVGPYGLSVDFIRDNSAEGSKYQIQLGVLQKFVCGEWTRLKQPTDGLCE